MGMKGRPKDSVVHEADVVQDKNDYGQINHLLKYKIEALYNTETNMDNGAVLLTFGAILCVDLYGGGGSMYLNFLRTERNFKVKSRCQQSRSDVHVLHFKQ